MRIEDFDIYSNMLKRKSGLTLTPDKSYLLDSRLTPIAKKWGYPTLEAMTMALRGIPDQNLVRDIVEAMTTNETSFFRDMKPFEIFQDTVLPYLIENRARERKMRIWSAACSTGQEPYSLAMLIKENQNFLAGWDIEIVATDLSTDVLRRAEAGTYSQFEVQRGLPIQNLVKYFEQDQEVWRLKDTVKHMVKFRQLNLLDDFSSLGKFDVVFCRNVLIYFAEETKIDVMNRISERMHKDSFLLLGGAETVLGISDTFRPMGTGRTVYIFQNGPHNVKNAEDQSQALA